MREEVEPHSRAARKQENRGGRKGNTIRVEEEVLGVNELDGREKQADELAVMANENSIHS